MTNEHTEYFVEKAVLYYLFENYDEQSFPEYVKFLTYGETREESTECLHKIFDIIKKKRCVPSYSEDDFQMLYDNYNSVYFYVKK